MTHVKICGFTRLEDVLFASQAGVWALGFNFYAKSPRYIAPEQALAIISALKPSPPTPLPQAGEGSGQLSTPLPQAGEGGGQFSTPLSQAEGRSGQFSTSLSQAGARQEKLSSILKIGIFIDESPQYILDTMASLSLDYAQVYTDLPLSKADKNRMILVLQAQDVNDLPSESVLSDYAFILLDAPKTGDGLMGGTGRLAQWDLAKQLAKNYRLILAGGLNPDNVQAAIEYVKPYAVDTASGVESAPGVKDSQHMKAFINRSHDHD